MKVGVGVQQLSKYPPDTPLDPPINRSEIIQINLSNSPSFIFLAIQSPTTNRCTYWTLVTLKLNVVIQDNTSSGSGIHEAHPGV